MLVAASCPKAVRRRGTPPTGFVELSARMVHCADEQPQLATMPEVGEPELLPPAGAKTISVITDGIEISKRPSRARAVLK